MKTKGVKWMGQPLFFVVLFTVLWSNPMQGQQQPCACCDENHRAFDFWVGEWNVRDATGNLLGTNSIERLQDGCLLRENWKGSGGTTGNSINYYNTVAGQWEQVWVDNAGNVLKLYGNVTEGAMIMSSESYEDPNGDSRQHRITWTLQKDGSVRQTWDVLNEEGEVIQTLFNGIYSRD
ncbi:hypothetical protein SAMN04490243_2464 [Robiginitalea myxolifaciens]|uniref:Uncharacterized protein n=1 Tax=Robiginitalea myxolifaciens TaxID=400055 RepID=A0A1I6HAG7_9FLAO|nr:hypothetical protein [Robiginitalea myxolifaciens]SFR51277.1 hypothetical protein SAMN04490243_2464 [Robiginitalea myxolifaciens]